MHVDAKAELSKRSLKNWGLCILMFVVWAVLAAFFLPSPVNLVADVVGIAVAYNFLFYFLERRHLLISCPKCKRKVATNTPWVCGVCKAENRNADEVPFINPCGTCGSTPKAYKCHHKARKRVCGNLIFLSADEQKHNYAYCLNTESVTEQASPQSIRSEKKDKKLFDIEMAELKIRLNEIKQRAKARKAKSSKEHAEEAFSKGFDFWLSVEEEAKKQRDIVKEKFKDDEIMLQKALDLIDKLTQELTPE